jgi:hypothetical protein
VLLQCANARDGPEADEPYVLVWDVRDLTSVIQRIAFPRGDPPAGAAGQGTPS